MRVLLDTNVLLAAHLTAGACEELLQYLDEFHELYASEQILAEFGGKLAGKFRQPAREVEFAVANLREHLKMVVPQALPKPVCRDRSDDVILGSALAGKCQCIVTGDKDLLILKAYKGVDILRPTDFWKYEAAVDK